MSFAIYRLADGASAAQSASETSFNVNYLLQGAATDTALDAAGALAHALTPQLGESYGDGFPSAVVVSVSPTSLGNGLEWLIQCRYSTDKNLLITSDASNDETSEAFIGGGYPAGYDPTGAGIPLDVVIDGDGRSQLVPVGDDDPRRLPWTFELSSRAVLVERASMFVVSDDGTLTATAANPMILTNGRPVAEALREPLMLPVIQLTKNVPNDYITPLQAAYFCGSVNKDAINIAGIQLLPRQAQITDFRLRRAWWGKGATRYWEVAINIAVFDGTERSDFWILQQDYYELLTPGANPTRILSPVDNDPMIRPSLLDAAGKKTTTPTYKKFAASNVRSWSPLKLPRRV